MIGRWLDILSLVMAAALAALLLLAVIEGA